MLLCILSGATQLFGNRAVENLVPDPILVAWAALLFLGSTVALFGIFWRDTTMGLLIESAGRHMLWPSAFAYAVAAWYYDRGWDSVVIIFAFGVTCLIRILHIRRLLDEWKAAMSNGN